jgi:hypothetical protein
MRPFIAVAVAAVTLALPCVAAEPSSSAAAAKPDGDEAPSAGDKHMKTDLGRVGLGLLAGGAALATATAAGVTLMQAVTHPDDDRTPPQNTDYVQISGFVTVAVASVAAGLMIAGGAMVLDETVAAAPAPPSGP